MNTTQNRETNAPQPRKSALFQFAAWVVVLWGLYEGQSFLIPICLAALLCFLMTPLVRMMSRLKLPEFLRIAITALLLVAPLVGVIYLAVAQIQSLIQNWPTLSVSLQNALANFRDTSLAHKLHLTQVLDPALLAHRAQGDVGSEMKLALESLGKILSAGSMLLLVLFFSVVMLASRNHIRHAAERLVSSYTGAPARSTIDEMGKLMETFLIARMGIAAGVGLAGLGAMLIFKVPYSFILCVIFGLMTWVPVVGIVLGMAPIIAVALAVGISTGSLLALCAILGTIWMIQDHILTPKWVGHRLKLNFLMTYLGFFAGERLWGAWGMFLSVPLMGLIRIALDTSPRLRPWAFALSEEDDQSNKHPRKAA
jgi:predicted PurR-regulated permease PerM